MYLDGVKLCDDCDHKWTECICWRVWGSPDWPSWQEVGKLAEFKMPDGEIVCGKLEYEDMTSGPDEAPLLFIRRPDGTQASLVDATHWRFAVNRTAPHE